MPHRTDLAVWSTMVITRDGTPVTVWCVCMYVCVCVYVYAIWVWGEGEERQDTRTLWGR
jgi:hypothetical protein